MRRILALSVLVAAILSAGRSSGLSPDMRLAKGAVPSWWTPELRDQVRDAGTRGVPLPPEVSASIPASSLAFVGIRPGQLLLVDNVAAGATSICTSNFVFTSGGSRFIGTAGHCGLTGDPVTMLFLPVGLVEIGTIVKSTGAPNNIAAVDFALISIKPGLVQHISPSMAHWGGPTGVFTGTGIQAVLHSGWGLAVGTGGTPRAGVAYAWNQGVEWRFEGVIIPGDSGSGAIVAGGLAAGNITHIAVNSGEIPTAWNGGTTMTRIMQYIGGTYSLATCALAIPWPLTGCP